jgi:hypothetical protein
LGTGYKPSTVTRRGQEALFFFCLGGARALRAELRIIPHPAQFVKSFLKNFFKNYFSQKY